MSSALAAIQSLLTAACPSHMETIFQREMWLCSDISDGEQLPIAAAFSPSGLLFSSQLFKSSLVHSEKVLMSALAIDRLCRGGLATTPSGVLRVARFPWMLQARKRVVDWCVVTLGDALALCIGFPRARNEASGPMVESLMRYIDGLRSAGQPSPGADLLHLCTHSTHPLTSHYYQAMLGLTELQLSSATWRDGFSASFHPTNGSAAEVASSGAAAAPPPISPRKKKGLSRLMCCMPFQLHKKPTAAAASFDTPATATPAETQDGAATQTAVEAPPSTGSTKRAVVRSPFTGGLPTLCYVASGISQADLECFRPLDGLGVHSMFFLLRTEHTAEKGHVPSQYGMGFYRPRLQSAEYENGSSDAAMLARRGCMAIHDPARILDVLGVTGATWLHTKPQDMEPMGQSLLMPTQMLSEAVPLSWVQLGTADAVLARYDMMARASTDDKTSVMIDDYEGDADTEEDEDDTLTSYYFTRSKKGFCMEEIVTVEGDYLHVDTVMSKALSTRSKITSAPDSMDRESGAHLKTLCNAIIQCQRAAQAIFDVALGQ